MSYPKDCIRGIPNQDALVSIEGRFEASASLFQFQNSSECGLWFTESINWMDDENAINFTLNQTKNRGELHFKEGIVLLALEKMKSINRKYGHFSYERKPIEDREDPSNNNKYHGNLLLSKEAQKPLKALIRSALAYHAEVKLREE